LLINYCQSWMYIRNLYIEDTIIKIFKDWGCVL
jgi:hypothetical protein